MKSWRDWPLGLSQHERMKVGRAGHIRPWVWQYGLAVVALAVSIVMFVELGRSARVGEPTDLDIAVHSWVVKQRPHWPELTAFFRLATRLGNPPIAVAATVIVALALLVLHLWGAQGIGKAEPLIWLGVLIGGRT